MPDRSHILDRGDFAPSITFARPVRLQRPRKQGYRTPEGVVYVGRPTMYSNPFDGRGFGHARGTRLFARWIDGRLGDLTLERLGFDPGEIQALHRYRYRLLAALPRLAGRNLQCWCPRTSRWCHADILMARANTLITRRLGL